MRWSATLVLPFLPLSVLAGKFNDPALRSRHARHAIQARTNSTKFAIADYYQGESFLKCVECESDSYFSFTLYLSVTGTSSRTPIPPTAMSTINRKHKLFKRVSHLYKQTELRS